MEKKNMICEKAGLCTFVHCLNRTVHQKDEDCGPDICSEFPEKVRCVEYSDPPSPEMVCPECKGTGYRKGYDPKDSVVIPTKLEDLACPKCHGTGLTPFQRGMNDTPACIENRDCPECFGTGKVPSPEPPEKVMEEFTENDFIIRLCTIINQLHIKISRNIEYSPRQIAELIVEDAKLFGWKSPNTATLPTQKLKKELAFYLWGRVAHETVYLDERKAWETQVTTLEKKRFLEKADSIILKLQQAGWGSNSELRDECARWEMLVNTKEARIKELQKRLEKYE